MLISVILTVVVLNFHYRGPKKSRVPYWCRRFIMGKIGFWLGFRFINREQLLSPSPSNKGISQRNNSNGDIQRPRSDHRIKLSVIPTVGTTTTATTGMANAQTGSASAVNIEDHEEDIVSATHRSLQQHSLTHSIEQILLKMQTQFDPSRIDDENLKIAILREILECQRLLLTIHARKQNAHAQSLYDIYEEWKVLAIIVDRICFIFYLVSMLAASIIFFVREPILGRNG